MKLSEIQNKEAIKPVSLKLSEIDQSQISLVEAPEPKKNANYFQRVAQDFSKAGQDIVSEVKKAATPTESIGGDIKQLGRTVLRGVGEIAGAAFSPVIQAPGIKQGLEYAGQKIAQIPGAEDVVKYATDFAKKNPELSKDAEAIINIVGLGAGKTVEAPIKTGVKNVADDVARSTKAIFTPSEQAIQKGVVELFNKSIKPTAKKSLDQGQKFETQTIEALKTIKRNVDQLNIEDETGELIAGRAPQSINELAQGLDQTKKIVFDQYDNLAKQANKKGAIIDTNSTIDEISKLATNKALQITNPEVIDYALNWAKRLKSFGKLDTETTQAVIKNINENLKSFYRNPTYESASKVAVDAGVVNNLRKSLDEVIQNATGKEYQALKNQYSALKAIENDVVRAAMREARKSAKGLLDYTDIFTSGQMLSGILSLNPAMFTKGAVERGFKEYIKFLNDPNRAIANIFEQLNVSN